MNLVAFGVAAAFLLWYLVGGTINRRRANALARVIQHALLPVGRQATIKPVGSSAFQITVEQPVETMAELTLLCLLEPRDFPLAWLWMRLRGHRDRMVLKASFRRPPPESVSFTGPRAGAPGHGLARLTALRLQSTAPHLHLAFSFGPGEESEIPRALQLVARLAAGEPATA